VIRGKRLVVLIGQRKAIAIAVKGGQTKRRWTKLREFLWSRLGLENGLNGWLTRPATNDMGVGEGNDLV
jgi:hypothetical protein